MLVTCKLLGGLGNNLFQICAVIAYSLKYKCDYCIPEHIDAPHEPGQKVFHSDKLNFCGGTLADAMGIKMSNAFNPTEVYTEPFFHYQEIPEYKCERLLLSGYFQSFRYFQDYRAEILTLLNIPKAISYGRVFLHYRLGDYRRLVKFHKMLSNEYLLKSVQLFYNKGYRDIMVFSDEIDSAKYILKGSNLFGTSRIKFHFSKGRTALQDLSLMAACAGGIMSPSSYSWWAAWLGNQDRLIVYQKDWFGPELKHDIKDLTMPNWIGL